MIKTISSVNNTLVKELIKLKEKSRERRKKGLFLIEGLRELSLAIKGNYNVKTVLFHPEIVSLDQLKQTLGKLIDKVELLEISIEVYKKIAYRETTEGVISVSEFVSKTIKDIELNTENPLILIAEAPEKPGNIGALLRTADAAKVDAVIITNPRTDLYNPNIIRSSVGCVFTNQVIETSSEEAIEYLSQNNIPTYLAYMSEESEAYYDSDFTKATAIVVGTEATGISDEWLRPEFKKIIIPMHGAIDSMNVSVAASILIFDAKRQRISK
ncbi:MAG: RNA methyltransferase [Flavobacteriaceae bacterium]|nr:RNA methyltransferase [Flavobacteriaceae bacterium]